MTPPPRIPLQRLESGAHGTFGRLAVAGLALYTGELPDRGNAPNRSCIPAGVYPAAFGWSPRFGRRAYLLHPVPGRAGIRIHPANLMGDADAGLRSQLNGCIALGERLGWIDGQRALLLSAPAVRRFEAALGGHPFTMEIGMLDLIGTIVGAIFSGGMTGLLGVAVQRLFDWLHAREARAAQADKFAHEATLRRIDGELMDKEYAGRLRLAETEAAGRLRAAEAEADARAFTASYALEPASYAAQLRPSRGQAWLLVILDVIRGLIRPLLTLYLCAVTTVIYWQMRDLLAESGEGLAAADALEMVRLVVGTVLYLTTTCILWYFGTRNKQPAPLPAR